MVANLVLEKKIKKKLAGLKSMYIFVLYKFKNTHKMNTQETLIVLQRLTELQELIQKAEIKEGNLLDTINNSFAYLGAEDKVKLCNDIDTVRMAKMRITRVYNTVKMQIFQ